MIYLIYGLCGHLAANRTHLSGLSVWYGLADNDKGPEIELHDLY